MICFGFSIYMKMLEKWKDFIERAIVDPFRLSSCFEYNAGQAAMIGFFMAYLVDSLTGVGLVDQMSNFFCKTLIFIAVVGVLPLRRNEDLDDLKKLL